MAELGLEKNIKICLQLQHQNMILSVCSDSQQPSIVVEGLATPGLV